MTSCLKRAAHSVYRACVSCTFVSFSCVLLSLLGLREGGGGLIVSY